MTCDVVHRALALASICIVFGVAAARADVDLTGDWDVEVQDEQLFPVFSGTWTFSHTAFGITTLDATSPPGIMFTGNLNPGSGAFSLITDPTPCTGPGSTTPRLDGTVDGTGVTFTGTLLKPYITPASCLYLQFDVIGRRICGNGVLDAGEQCDDANARDGDCCSTTCQLATRARHAGRAAPATRTAPACSPRSQTQGASDRSSPARPGSP